MDRCPSNERQEGQAWSAPRLVSRLCCWAAKSLECSHLCLRISLPNQTLDISSSFWSLLAESRGHQRLQEAIAKLRFAPALVPGFKEIEINSPVKRSLRSLRSNIISIQEEYIEGSTNSRIHHFLAECIAFKQRTLRHFLPDCINCTTNNTRMSHRRTDVASE